MSLVQIEKEHTRADICETSVAVEEDAFSLVGRKRRHLDQIPMEKEKRNMSLHYKTIQIQSIPGPT